MTKKNLFEKKLLTVSLGLAALMLSFGLALALTNCGGDDDDAPAVVYYGDTTVANDESGVLTSTFVGFTDLTTQDIITDWFPGLKALGGSVSGSVSSTGSGKTITLTFTTTKLTVPSVTKKLVIPKTAFSPALAEDLDTGIEITFISGKTPFTAKKAEDIRAAIEGLSLSSLANTSTDDGKITISLSSVNLKYGSATVTATLYKNDLTTPLKTIGAEITSESTASLKLNPQDLVADDSFYDSVEYSSGAITKKLGAIKVGFTVTDAAGESSEGTLWIAEKSGYNQSLYGELNTAIQAVNDARKILDTLKSTSGLKVSSAFNSYGSKDIVLTTDIYPPAFPSSVNTKSLIKTRSGKATQVYLSGSGSSSYHLGVTATADGWKSANSASNGNQAFDDIQLQYNSKFYYNYSGTITVFINES